jgi:hypothetical protein
MGCGVLLARGNSVIVVIHVGGSIATRLPLFPELRGPIFRLQAPSNEPIIIESKAAHFAKSL